MVRPPIAGVLCTRMYARESTRLLYVTPACTEMLASLESEATAARRASPTIPPREKRSAPLGDKSPSCRGPPAGRAEFLLLQSYQVEPKALLGWPLREKRFLNPRGRAILARSWSPRPLSSVTARPRHPRKNRSRRQGLAAAPKRRLPDGSGPNDSQVRDPGRVRTRLRREGKG